MGEYADMFLNGFVDSETGEMIDGDSPRYPRRKTRKASRVACPICGKEVRTNGLNDHMRSKHPEEGADS